MDIGVKIKALRLKNNLTQEELADRCELTKGYISQLENNLTNPSIGTLEDILVVLGSGLGAFFQDEDTDRYVFGKADFFSKNYDGSKITWLVPSAQKKFYGTYSARNWKKKAAAKPICPTKGKNSDIYFTVK